MGSQPRPRRTAFWLATGAVAWAAAFTVWVLTASIYEPGGETVLEANAEWTVRVAVFVPLAVSAFAWLALHLACRTANRAARTAGIAAAGSLLAFSLLTGFTIGAFVLPGAVALTAAALITPLRRSESG